MGKYFGESEVVLFHEKQELTWDGAREASPHLTKGWFELSKLEPGVRLEFIRDYWINSLPFSPQFYAFVDRFFSKVQEVGIVAVRGDVYMTYALKSALFFGGPPLVDREIELIKEQFDFPLPLDYLQFFRVHNGLSRGEESGLFPSRLLLDETEKIHSRKGVLKYGSKEIDPRELFPFYHDSTYQCFYKSWTIDEEVGNVHCSLHDGRVSDSSAFPSFLDWLTHYLEPKSEE
ncbi:MAG: hypothetical protein K1060chlam2_01437 [Chlamydiae bacterium]|nr:hypothetical protein [Chlamydiota bacterium]